LQAVVKLLECGLGRAVRARDDAGAGAELMMDREEDYWGIKSIMV
jgi:hypothetical protein